MLKGIQPIHGQAAVQQDTRQISEADGLKKAAQAFEGMLLNELFKAMRRSVPDSEVLGGGMGRDIFTSMLDEKLAEQSSERGSLGIAEAITRQLSGANGHLQRYETQAGMPNPVALQGLGDGQWNQPLAQVPSNISEGQRFGAARVGQRPEQCGEGHCGLDLAKPVGTPVVSVREGVVVKIQKDAQSAGGLGVTVKHGPFISKYLHLSEVSKDVQEGQRIEAGQKIGEVGNTGKASKGAHLHFELSFQGDAGMERIDPEPYMRTWKKTNVQF
jgi:murein DD-endopeptidase MepM/ murein hydrolase activator NlpD